MRRRDGIVVAIAGGVMLLSFAAIGIGSPALGSTWYLQLVALAVAGYAAGLGAVFAAGAGVSGRCITACLLLALAFRAPLWMTGPGRDVHRYVWDARVTAAGYDPFVVAPSDPRLLALHTDETKVIDHPDLPTPYPPGAQLLFRLVSLFSARAWAFKVAFGVCDVLLGLVLWWWLGARGAPAAWILVYAWNPLVILVTAGEAHVDVAGALCLVASAALLLAGHRMSSAIAFVLAVAIKPLPIVLVPLFWRRIRMRDAAAGAAVLALLYLPYLRGGHLPVGSLGAFIDGFRFNSPLFAAGAVLGARAATALAVAAAAALAIVLRARRPVEAPGGWAWPMALALAASPVVYPWYLVWLVPFATSVETLPLLAWSASILCTYRVWHLSRLGGAWAVPPGLLVFEFGVVALAAAVSLVALRRSRARRGPGNGSRPAAPAPARSSAGSPLG